MINQLLVYRPGVGLVQAGEVVQLTQGDILQVTVSFNYRCHENGVIHLRGSIGDPADPAAQGRQEVSLSASESFVSKTSYVNIPTSKGGVIANATPPGTYDLTVSVDESPEDYDTVPACITVVAKAGILDTLMAIMPLMILMMMMGIMTPMMRGGEEGTSEGGKEETTEGG